MSSTDSPRIKGIDSDDSRARFRSDARGLESEKVGASVPTSQVGRGAKREPGACLAGTTPGSFYHQQIKWTPDKIAILRQLWSEEIPTQEIANRMGVSKNAVIGTVHRRSLPKRESPIHPRKEPKIEAPKLLTLADLGPGQCRFPEGDPEDVDFNFCGEPVIEGKPYCASHCERAYGRVVKERKDTEAA